MACSLVRTDNEFGDVNASVKMAEDVRTNAHAVGETRILDLFVFLANTEASDERTAFSFDRYSTLGVI